MRTINRHRWLVLGRVVIAALALFLITVSCSKERSLGPVPVHYRLYSAGSNDGKAVIEVIDTESDSVTDIFTDISPSTVIQGMDLSRDGKYIGVVQHTDVMFVRRPAFVLDARTHEVVMELPTAIKELLFMSNGKTLLGICDDSTLVYSVPSFTLTDVWRVEMMLCREVPGTSWLIGLDRTPPSQDRPDLGLIMVFDRDTRALKDSLRIDQHTADFGFSVLALKVFSDHRTIAVCNGLELIRFDYMNKQILYRVTIGSDASPEIFVSPDESEIWIAKHMPESQIGHPYIGYIMVADANTGAILDTIHTDGLRLDRPGKPIPVENICFHPTLPKVYVSSYEAQPGLLVINRTTRQITKTLFGEAHHTVLLLEMAPY